MSERIRLPDEPALYPVVPRHRVQEQTSTGRPMTIRMSETALRYYQPPRDVQRPRVLAERPPQTKPPRVAARGGSHD